MNNTFNAVDWFTNQWDNGYPSGGNYWDEYAGIDADLDGIGDTPFALAGGGWDHYPLMEPYGGVAPVSSVNAIVSKIGENPINISINAYDEHSQVKSVTLWCRYSADNLTWGPWDSWFTYNHEPWNNTIYLGQYGYFEFYSTAVDVYDNAEEPPPAADAVYHYRPPPVLSWVAPIYPYAFNTGSVQINASTNSSFSTIDSISLWYRFSPDNRTWTDDEFFEVVAAAPWEWTFPFPNGEGFYEFYSIAHDANAYLDSRPNTLNASCRQDITLPVVYLATHVNNTYLQPGGQMTIYYVDSGTYNETCTWTVFQNSNGFSGLWGYTLFKWSGERYYVNSTCRDQAGNIGQAFFEFKVDTTNPRIVSTTPDDGAVEVPPNNAITVKFSEPMNTILREGIIILEPTFDIAIATWNAAGDTLTLVPDGGLAANTTYHVTFTASMNDIAGNSLVRYTWMFSTSADTDGDGLPDDIDADDDGDGTADEDDAFPLNPDESLDTDGDGIGNNADDDDDNDGVPDTEDFDPLDPEITKDPDAKTFIGQYWWVILILVLVPAVIALAYLTRKKKPPVGDEPALSETQERSP